MLLVDTGHGNSFTTEEVSALLSRVADRGYDVEFNRFGVPQLLEEKLRKADSLAVIVPARPYSEEEVDVIGRFVKKGGKLLLIADPTRRNEINSLAERFGIAFQADYLYNTKEYDINFQNIFIRDFVPDELTDGLSQIALYTAGSIRSSEPHLAYTDANTRSNIVERIETFYPIVKRRDGRVLAISDLTFMIPPQNSILDNDRLGLQHSRLPHGERERVRAYRLPPPHFFSDDVDILLGRASLFDIGTDLKGNLLDLDIESTIRGIEDLTRDTVYVGLYEDSGDVAQYLSVAGIQVDDTLRTPFTPNIGTIGSAIILLHRTQEKRVLVVLGGSERSLADIVRRLASGQFRSGLVSELLGVYRSF